MTNSRIGKTYRLFVEVYAHTVNKKTGKVLLKDSGVKCVCLNGKVFYYDV